MPSSFNFASYQWHMHQCPEDVPRDIESWLEEFVLLGECAKAEHIVFENRDRHMSTYQWIDSRIDIGRCSFDRHRHQSMDQPTSIISCYRLTYEQAKNTHIGICLSKFVRNSAHTANQCVTFDQWSSVNRQQFHRIRQDQLSSCTGLSTVFTIAC